MMKEIFGRVGGTSGGKGGSMHIADFSVGMMGANGILADGMTLAVGAAQAVTIKNEDRIVCVFVGDGTTNRGPFYESLNWARVFMLPLLIVCEDNRYASTTITSTVTAGRGAAARAEAFEIPAVTVDGNDVLAVDAAALELVRRIREGEGPQMLHALTYRVRGHVSRDPLKYRAQGEGEEQWKREPIGRCASWLRDHGISDDRIRAAETAAKQRIAEAIAEAKTAPFPEPRLAFTDVQDMGGAYG
jgi:pyruvate dehydrogenase E1 component alpha subunit